MRPAIRRDLAPFGQLDHVDGRLVAPRSACRHFRAASNFQIAVSRGRAQPFQRTLGLTREDRPAHAAERGTIGIDKALAGNVSVKGNVMHLSNQGLLVIIIVGIVAGWLAGRVMEGVVLD